MRVAVLGSAGQLGREFCRMLPASDVLPLTRNEIDLGRVGGIQAAIDSLDVDLLLNCAAYNHVDRAESEPDAAFAVNAWGVRELALACKQAKVKLVHFSTDYVFGLEPGKSPFTEQDAPGPASVYGLSKLAGEYLVRSIDPDALVIRTCGLYGVWAVGGKGNFVETMLRLAGEGKPLRVVDDQHCTPTYTRDLAKTTLELVKSGAAGLFHVTNAGDCSWFEFACEIFRLTGLDVSISPCSSSEYPRPARRPGYSVLSCEKLGRQGVPIPRPWPEALAAYLVVRNTRT
jgi:dTDP-4-dehydrorhamnose reductase